MIKALIPAFLTILIATSLQAQTLKMDEVDEFTGTNKKETSWCPLQASMKFGAKISWVRRDSVVAFKLKMTVGTGKVFSIHENQEIMLKLTNGEVIKATANSSEVTCRGCGATGFSGSNAMGIEVYYSISNADLAKLQSTLVEKIRIYTASGYHEGKVKEPKALVFQNALKLVL